MKRWNCTLYRYRSCFLSYPIGYCCRCHGNACPSSEIIFKFFFKLLTHLAFVLLMTSQCVVEILMNMFSNLNKIKSANIVRCGLLIIKEKVLVAVNIRRWPTCHPFTRRCNFKFSPAKKWTRCALFSLFQFNLLYKTFILLSSFIFSKMFLY